MSRTLNSPAARGTCGPQPRRRLPRRHGAILTAVLLSWSATSIVTAPASFASSSPPTTLTFPAGVATSSQLVDIGGVSCAGVNTCVVVGSVRVGSSVAQRHDAPFAARLIDGILSTAVILPLPSNAISSTWSSSGPRTGLDAVSCPAATSCTAVGTYDTATGFAPFVVSFNGSAWTPPQEILPPTSTVAHGSASALGVSCATTTTCVVVGDYESAVSTYLPFSATNTGTSWKTARVPLPSGADTAFQDAELSGVSCWSAFMCVAVGSATVGTNQVDLVASDDHGTWTPTALPVPANDSTGDASLLNGLNAVSCWGPWSCAAVGQFGTATGESSTSVTSSPVGHQASWATMTWVTVPTLHPAPSSPLSELLSVSCSSATTCSAGGFVGSATSVSADVGSLTSVDLASTPSTATSGNAAVSALWCYSDDHCLDVGTFTASGNVEAFATIPDTEPGAPTNVVAVGGNAHVTVTWTAPSYTGLSPIIHYIATATPSGLTCTTTTTTCVISGLTNGETYRVSVVADNAVGTSVASSLSPAVTPVTVPSAPTVSTATPLVGGVRVIFSPPSSTGGSPITTYQYSLTIGATWHVRTSGTTTSPLVVTGLARHHRYRIVLRALNAVGASPRSNIATFVTK